MITRRGTLLGAASLAGLAALPAGSGGGTAPLGPVPRSRESALAVGRAFLAVHPAERDAAFLGAVLEADLGLAVQGPGDGTALEQAVAAAVRADFIARRTVKVDGWVLARTEARLCALIVVTAA